MQQALSATETMLMLCKSTGNYVYKRIYVDKNRIAYKNSMSMCIDVLKQGLTNVDMIRLKVEGLREESQHLFKKSLFNGRVDEINYHNMAISHTIDIINKLEMRFITGGYDPEPRNYRGHSLDVYDGSNIF